MKIDAIHAECVSEMNKLAEKGVQFDSIVTDPPYHLTSITKRFSKGEPAHTKTAQDIAGRKTPMARHAKGFLGQRWDGGDVAFRVETWQAAYRVLKPGGWLLAFGSTRGHHRMMCAIEDAGFEIRDCFLDLLSTDTRVKNFVETLTLEQAGAFAEIVQQAGMQGLLAWVYGSGMPKSLDASKAIDEHLGVKRESFAPPVTPEAKQWQGWGTGLTPAWEPIVIARKTIKGSVAKNLLKYGTGTLNIDESRIPLAQNDSLCEGVKMQDGVPMDKEGHWGFKRQSRPADLDRWPKNVLQDGSVELSPRFFYSAKAGENDKVEDSDHPTVKPVSLIYYLTRLVTPKGGSVLDPFAGTGTLATAAHYLNVDATLIEADDGYFKDIQRRIKGLKSEGLFT